MKHCLWVVKVLLVASVTSHCFILTWMICKHLVSIQNGLPNMSSENVYLLKSSAHLIYQKQTWGKKIPPVTSMHKRGKAAFPRTCRLKLNISKHTI